jgi:hypothetical protein
MINEDKQNSIIRADKLAKGDVAVAYDFTLWIVGEPRFEVSPVLGDVVRATLLPRGLNGPVQHIELKPSQKVRIRKR